MDSNRPDIGYEASPHPENSEQPLYFTRREKNSIAGSNLFKCPQCEKEFTRQVDLKRHVKVHCSKEGAVHEYSCTECEKKFSRRHIWKAHLLVCPKSRQVQQHSPSLGLTDIRNPLTVSDIHQSLFPPGLPANGLTRTNSTSKTSNISSLQKDGTSHNEDDPGQSGFGMDALNTPRGSPVPRTTTVGESRWMGYSDYFGDSDATNMLSASASVNGFDFPAASSSYESNSLYTIDHLNLLASRTEEPAETVHLGESSAIAGSSKHRGRMTNLAESPVGMDASRRNSIRVQTGRWNPLQESFQEFLAFFGDRLIQETRSKRWMERRMVQCSNKTKKLISRLLENYAAEMMWNYCCTQHYAITIDQESNSSLEDSWTLIEDTIELIHHCRAHIVDYFCYNSTEGLEIAAYTVDNPLEATQQQSVLRWYSSFEKSKSSQKRSRNIGDLIYNKTGTAEEKTVSSGFDIVKETLFTNEAFQKLKIQLIEELLYNSASMVSTMSQIVTSEFDLPHGINTQVLRVVFNIDWNILGFMRSQYGGIVPIATVVVLTGSSTNAQATVCGEYVRQNWPLVGPEVLKIIDKSLASGSRHRVRVKSGSSPIRYIREFVLM
jgi:hypothetical protein